MLLYTRLAQPKVPKKRSRAGCNFCKEKKKKCDEARPTCSRCVEHQQDCVYEPIKPRQRRKRESLSVDTTIVHASESAHLSQHTPQSAGGLTIQQWDQQQRWKTGAGGREDVTGAVRGGEEVDMAATMAMPTHLQIPPMGLGDGMSIVDPLFTPWTPADTTAFSPMTPSPFDFALPPLDENDDPEIEEIIRRESTSLHSPSQALVPAISATAPNHHHHHHHHHHQDPSPHLEFCHPAFAEFSPNKHRRALVGHFCNVLSHLIVFREDNGNPFQQLVLPLSRRSSAVMDAIYALASAHLEFRGVAVGGEKSEYFHGRAIQELARLIEERGRRGDRNELLAAIMLLVYYEVLVQRGRSNIVDGHLKGAMTLMENQPASTDPTGVFLERAFRFYDVIAALSFGTAPLSSAPGRGSLFPLPPIDSRGAASPSGSVDTLLGLATSLWPVIHRLSNLSSVKEELNQAVAQGLVSKVAVLRTELETTTAAILAALEQWQPVLAPSDEAVYEEESANGGRGEQGRIQSILNNALAYRHSAFVYLYRVIRDYPRSHPLVQHHAHLSLTHCVGTVSHEGPMSALLWPLFVAACESTSVVDRQLARQAFVAIDRRQGMTNIERAWCIVQEVWQRADAMELESMLQRTTGQVMADSMGMGSSSSSSTHNTNNNNNTNINAGSGGAGQAGCDVGEDLLVGSASGEQEDHVTVRGVPARRRGSFSHVRQGRGAGGDLWRRVSKDMGVTIVFG